MASERAVGDSMGRRPEAVVEWTESAGIWVSRERLLMGTRMRVRVRSSDRAAGLLAIEEAMAETARLEGTLSSWSVDSEVARINRAPLGEALHLSERLGGVLEQAVRWSRETHGAFDPRLGPLGSTAPPDVQARVPRSGKGADLRSAVGSKGLALDFDSRTATRMREGARIDTGGFWKGAALAAVGRVLAAHGIRDGIVDLGGQLVVLGTPGDARAWPIWIAHPGERLCPTTRLRVRDASVATSGSAALDSGRDGSRSSIVNPLTSEWAPPWGSVTVVSEDPLAADAVATALFAMGPVSGFEWARVRRDLGVLFSIPRPDGTIEIRWNRKMEDWLDPLVASEASSSTRKRPTCDASIGGI